MKRIGVISDTHGTFDDVLRDFLRDVDEIWHAGDFGSIELADEIAKFKPLRGVFGNIDGGVMRRAYNEFSFFECEGKRIVSLENAAVSGGFGEAIGAELKFGWPDRFMPHAEVCELEREAGFDVEAITEAING